jgi:hypothetical protein
MDITLFSIPITTSPNFRNFYIFCAAHCIVLNFLAPTLFIDPKFDRIYRSYTLNKDPEFGIGVLDRADTICAIGFEPNPRHTSSLKEIEAAHKLCGWSTFFYTEVAASQDYGPINFVSDNNLKMKEWGGGIVAGQRKYEVFKFSYAKFNTGVPNLGHARF